MTNTGSKNTVVITIAWGFQFIESILTRIEDEAEIKFIHIVSDENYRKLLDHGYNKDFLKKIPNASEIKNFAIDLSFLSRLEQAGSIPIKQFILSDRIAKNLNYNETLIYASAISIFLYDSYKYYNPTYVIGAWDSMIQGLGMSVSRLLGIPFYITKFSVIPANHLTFCSYPNPNSEIYFTEIPPEEAILKATTTLENWENKRITAPAYISAKTISDIIKRIPNHLYQLYKQIKNRNTFGFNKFTSYKLKQSLSQYFRKKKNILLLNRKIYTSEIPTTPYFFFGLHMQPESSIDVMAPFYSSQFFVIETIARSMPITHSLLVKIHVSDADNYSPNQLKRLMQLPGVKIVSPFVGSRKFIENADIVLTIQGTIGLEACLLGKPLIIFGDSPIKNFPTATKVNCIEDLPKIIRAKLIEARTTKKAIIESYANFLKNYLPSCSDDWDVTLKKGLSESEIRNFVTIFKKLTQFVINQIR